MEVRNFAKICKMPKFTSSAMLKQRKKLNPEVFRHLAVKVFSPFYSSYKDEVRTIKGYVIAAIDGSDIEVPNTKKSMR